MVMSDPFDIASEDELEAADTRPKRTTAIVSSASALAAASSLPPEPEPDVVEATTTSELGSGTITPPPHEAASTFADSEVADLPLNSFCPPLLADPDPMLVTSEAAPLSAQGDDPAELRAVLVSNHGRHYHLYRPPPLSWFESETSRTTSTSSGIEGTTTATTTATTTSDRNDQSVGSGESSSVIHEQQHRQQQHVNSYAAGVASERDGSTVGTARGSNEEEKEEITDTFDFFNQSVAAAACPIHEDPLAGMPTYSVVGTYATLPEQATVLGGESSHHTAACSDDDDDESDLAALKRAAAYGGGANQKPQPRATEDLDRFFARTCEYWNALAVDAQAAAGCGDTIDICRVMEDSTRLAQQHYAAMTAVAYPEVSQQQVATVIEVSEEFVHPSDLLSQNAVQAEFVGEEYMGSHHQQQYHHPLEAMDPIHSAAAATALSTDRQNITQAASDVYGGCYFDDTVAGDHATTVAQHVSTVAQHVSSPTATAIQATQVHDCFYEQAAEATVIDSAPASKAESQIAWQNTEEAQVLQDESSSAVDDSMMDRKPPAVEIAGRQLSNRGDSFAVAEQVGDVLSIEEALHPAEYLDVNHAEAELVGTDFLFTAGVESTEAASADAAFSSTVEPLASPSSSAATREAMCMAPQPRVTISPPSAEVIYSTFPRAAGDGEVHAVLVDDTSAVRSSVVPVATPLQDRTPSDSSDQSAVKFFHDSVDTVGVSATVNQVDTELPVTSTLHAPPRACSGGTSDHSGYEPAPVTGLPRDSPPTPEWLHESPARETAERQASEQSHGSQRSQLQLVSERASQMTAQLARSTGQLARSTGSVMESLFGDTRPPLVGGRRGRANASDVAHSVFARTLLPWSVIPTASNQTWVATLQTNQKALDGKNVKEASKSLRAFSLPSEKQAICLAKSWTPPRMQPFQENPNCHICKTKFAIFRRSCHCRNCGVCICKDCAVQWPAKMIPETYNIKKENMLNVCKSCEWLCNTFRLVLLEGKMDEAVAVHATGNVNLTMPFANVKGEEFFPVHCAVLGGNPELLRWLVDEHCCPIKSVRVSGKAARDLTNQYTPIVTSRGRSLLGIAMENVNVEIVRYLVVNKGLSIAGEKDITTGMLIKNLDKVLRIIPDTAYPSVASYHSDPPESPDYVEGDYVPPPPSAPTSDADPHGPNDEYAGAGFGASRGDWVADEADELQDDDECRLCFDGKIDCVATPCGHQMCCLTCSSHISRCPVCAQDCSFLRVFKS